MTYFDRLELDLHRSLLAVLTAPDHKLPDAIDRLLFDACSLGWYGCAQQPVQCEARIETIRAAHSALNLRLRLARARGQVQLRMRRKLTDDTLVLVARLAECADWHRTVAALAGQPTCPRIAA